MVSPAKAIAAAASIVAFAWSWSNPVLSSLPFVVTNIVFPIGKYDSIVTLPFPSLWVDVKVIPIPAAIWVTIPVNASPVPM